MKMEMFSKVKKEITAVLLIQLIQKLKRCLENICRETDNRKEEECKTED